jgi:hypothetical protein
MRLRVLVIGALLSMLAATSAAPAQPLGPTFPGWERYFSVSWEPFERRGQPYLRGYIASSYGVTATRVQLLVDSLDTSGQIVAQRVEWLGGQRPAGILDYLLRGSHSPASLALSRERVRIRLRAVGAD